MSPGAVAAAIAWLLLVAAAIVPRRPLLLAATLACAAAIAIQLPGHGFGAVGLVVAAGLAMAAGHVAPGAARLLSLLAALWAAGAALAPHPPVPVNWPILWTNGVIMALAAAAVAATATRLLERPVERTCLWVAVLLAFAPMGSGGPLLPLGAAVELPLTDGTGAWLQSAALSFASAQMPPWAPWLWRYLPWLLLALTLIGHARRGPRLVAVVLALGLAALAATVAAWSQPALAWLNGDLNVLAAAGQAFPARALASQRAVDVAPLTMALARLATIGVLIWPRSLPSRPADEPGSMARRFEVATLVLAGAALLSWCLLAPSWAGALWVFDPAAMAVLATLVAGFGVLWAHPRADAAWPWRLVQLAAALLAIGGGDLGWRVAGLLMLD